MLIYLDVSRGAEPQCDCKRDKLWVRLPLEEIKYLIFLFLRFGSGRGKERRWVPPLNMPPELNSTEHGKRSVFTLGSLP